MQICQNICDNLLYTCDSYHSWVTRSYHDHVFCMCEVFYKSGLKIDLKSIIESKSSPIIDSEFFDRFRALIAIHKIILWPLTLCDLDDSLSNMCFCLQIGYKGNCSYLGSSLPVNNGMLHFMIFTYLENNKAFIFHIFNYHVRLLDC